jgi:replicative DNA helicase
LKKIIPNPNNDIIPKEAWKLIIEPAKQEMEMSWRQISQGLNMSYCGSALFKSGLSRLRMVRVHNVLKDSNILALAKSDIYWDKIVSIKKLRIEKVYDATVEGAHNFIADDIIVHNSLEQDADVVLFIYREDRYRPDTDRKGIADIIIAKHRNGPVGKVELYFDEQRASFRNLQKEEYSGGEDETEN